MLCPGPDDKIYPVIKLATILDSLAAEGIAAEEALVGVGMSKDMAFSPSTRVSHNQIIACYRNADRLWHQPHFAYQAGTQLHVSAYGMYGFAILSSTNFRQTIAVAMQYHQLSTPLADIGFREEQGCGIWTVTPLSHPSVDANLYRYLVELQFGTFMSLHRDVMGPEFVATELHVTYNPPIASAKYAAMFGCPVQFGQPENRFVFDASRLDEKPQFGNQIAHAAIVELCDSMMEEFKLRIGVAGKVRRVLLTNLMRPLPVAEVARRVHMSARTLHRKLVEENISYRKLVDELRMGIAIKYLRDTNLSVEDVAHALGFSDAANFRQSFRRWTNSTPHQFRETTHNAPANS